MLQVRWFLLGRRVVVGTEQGPGMPKGLRGLSVLLPFWERGLFEERCRCWKKGMHAMAAIACDS